MKKINFKSLVRPKFFWATIVLLLLVTSAAFYLLKENERKLKIFTQEQLTKAIENKNVVASKLIQTIKVKRKVEEKFNAEKKRSLALEKEVEEKDNQIRLTLDKLEKETVARREAEAQLLIAVRENRALETELKEFTKGTETIELEKIIVKAFSKVVGKVLAANKEHAFIVVNLGRANNLMLGDVLSVYRNDKLIGRAEVEKVAEKMAAATILPEWQDVEFEENDEVRKL